MTVLACAVGLAVCLPAVIDRFEGAFAVVEWSASGRLGDVPRERLPRGLREGDRVVLSARLGPRGEGFGVSAAPPALATPWGLLAMPPQSPVRPGRPYVLSFQVPPWGPRVPSLQHKRMKS